MGRRKAKIQALIVRCETDLAKVTKEYRDSLDAQEVSNELKIDIKNLCENLRSVLDYIAHDARDQYCPGADPTTRIYFPILPSRPEFEAQVGKWYPGLESSAPDLCAYLERIQPYHDSFRWLAAFNRVNNENKHENLVAQTRTEKEQVKVSGSRGSVSWFPKSVKFGRGVFIQGVPIDPSTQMPVPDPSQKVQRIIWVDFRFADLNVSVVELLKEAVAGIKGIAIATDVWL